MKTQYRYLAAIMTSVTIAGLLLLAEPASGDDDGLREFRRMLEKGSSDVTFRTEETLEKLGLKTADVVPVLAETFTRSRARKKVRRTAAKVALNLAEAGEGAPLVPALARAIHDENQQVASDGLRALRNVGPEAVSAMPDLIELMRDTPPWQTLQPIQAIGEAAIPYLVEGLKSDALSVRTTCAQALVDLGAEQEIRGPLTDPFADPSGELQAQAARSPLFVSRVEELLAPSADFEGLGVVFEALATPYELEPDHPDFELFRARLEVSLKDRWKVLFAHESSRLTRVLRGSRPDWLEIDTSPHYGCLLVADDPVPEGTECTIIGTRLLDLAVSNFFHGLSFVPVDFLNPLFKGELFFWSSRERQVFNAGFVEVLTSWPGPGPSSGSSVLARFAHPSLEEALTQALAVPEIPPEDEHRLSTALQIVRDELKTFGGSANP